jgi:uncharacterized protein (TIGR02594 family)
MALGLVTYPALVGAFLANSQTSRTDEESFDQLVYPPLETLENPELFGYKPATEAQKRKAQEIVDGTPKGPKPIDIAQSLVDRFYDKEPDAISQWPAPASWNPLIVEFFKATSTPANSDMIPWCAAFANWCIERSRRNGSRSASSQSFLSKDFMQTDDPRAGDLAIFTCYDNSSGKSLGLGHATFFKERLSQNRIKVVGGNQSRDRHSSVICETEFSTTDHDARRHVGDKYVPCTMRLNTYIRIV